MQTFSDTEQEKVRAAFYALVMGIGPAPELEELTDRPVRARLISQPRRRGPMLAAAVFGLLLGIGLTAFLVSDGSLDVAGGPFDRGDVLVFFAPGTPFDTLVDVADELMTWEGVVVASPWTSEDAAAEFAEAFADQPDLVALIQQDPSVLPPSVRVWVDPGTDVSVMAQRVGEEFTEAMEVRFKGEEPQAADIPESTLPPLEILATQVEPIYGYGDYSGYSYAEVPWDRVTAAEIACMQDQGWPVEPDGNTGMLWTAVPVEDNQAAQIDFARCLAGLNLPSG